MLYERKFKMQNIGRSMASILLMQHITMLVSLCCHGLAGDINHVPHGYEDGWLEIGEIMEWPSSAVIDLPLSIVKRWPA